METQTRSGTDSFAGSPITRHAPAPGRTLTLPLPNLGTGQHAARIRVLDPHGARNSGGSDGWVNLFSPDPDGTVVSELPPVAVSLDRASAPAGAPGFDLTIAGGFLPSAVVLWNGQPRAGVSENATALRAGTRLTARIPASDLAAGGVAQVQVANPSLHRAAGLRAPQPDRVQRDRPPPPLAEPLLGPPLAATAVGTGSAALNGTVNPRGLATTYRFQYGTSPLYGQESRAVGRLGPGRGLRHRHDRRPRAGDDLPLPSGREQRRRHRLGPEPAPHHPDRAARPAASTAPTAPARPAHPRSPRARGRRADRDHRRGDRHRPGGARPQRDGQHPRPTGNRSL